MGCCQENNSVILNTCYRQHPEDYTYRPSRIDNTGTTLTPVQSVVDNFSNYLSSIPAVLRPSLMNKEVPPFSLVISQRKKSQDIDTGSTSEWPNYESLMYVCALHHLFIIIHREHSEERKEGAPFLKRRNIFMKVSSRHFHLGTFSSFHRDNFLTTSKWKLSTP